MRRSCFAWKCTNQTACGCRHPASRNHPPSRNRPTHCSSQPRRKTHSILRSFSRLLTKYRPRWWSNSASLRTDPRQRPRPRQEQLSRREWKDRMEAVLHQFQWRTICSLWYRNARLWLHWLVRKAWNLSGLPSMWRQMEDRTVRIWCEQGHHIMSPFRVQETWMESSRVPAK